MLKVCILSHFVIGGTLSVLGHCFFLFSFFKKTFGEGRQPARGSPAVLSDHGGCSVKRSCQKFKFAEFTCFCLPSPEFPQEISSFLGRAYISPEQIVCVEHIPDEVRLLVLNSYAL